MAVIESSTNLDHVDLLGRHPNIDPDKVGIVHYLKLWSSNN